eukprot:g27269.t1
MLKVNNTLQTLDLYKNNIGPDGAKAIGKALEYYFLLWGLCVETIMEPCMNPASSVHLVEALLDSMGRNRVTVPIKLADWSIRRLTCPSSAGRSCRGASFAHYRSARTVRVSSVALEITPAARSRSMRR